MMTFKQTLAIFILFWLFIGAANCQTLVNSVYRVDHQGTSDREYIDEITFAYTENAVCEKTDSTTVCYRFTEEPILDKYRKVFITTNGEYIFFSNGIPSVVWKPLFGEVDMNMYMYRNRKLDNYDPTDKLR